MKRIAKQFFIFTIVLGFTALLGTDAFADAGGGLRSDFEAAVKGSVGTTAGLAVSLVGLYMWIWSQVSWGIVVALGGALLTAFPGIYESIGDFGKAAFSESLGTSGGSSSSSSSGSSGGYASDGSKLSPGQGYNE